MSKSKSNSAKSNSLPWCACCEVSAAVENRSRLTTPPASSGGVAYSWRIASGTLLQKNHSLSGKLCDFIVLAQPATGQTKSILAEMKSKSTHASKVQEQFQGGADLLSASTYPIVPVLVHNGIDTMEIKLLGKARVSHRGKKYPISIMRSPKDASQL